MVVVGEDCALDEGGTAGRRGLAGTAFVHKIAGAAAAAGCTLDEVTAQAEHVARSIGTMGVGLSVCTLPGKPTPDRLGVSLPCDCRGQGPRTLFFASAIIHQPTSVTRESSLLIARSPRLCDAVGLCVNRCRVVIVG